jgi:hypothetical protein
MARYIYLFSIVFLLSTSHTFAQISQFPEGDIEYQFVPISPKAFQNVRVTLVSYIEDLNSASITWRVDGQTSASGKGLKNFSFKTGSVTQTVVLEIFVKLNDGRLSQKTYRIKPVDVDLVWQSESFTPPFYRGKKMFSHENNLTFVAIPHMTDGSGVEINPKNLTYKWTRNDQVIDYASGYGKNILSYKGPLISRTQSIHVEVTDPNSSQRGFAIIDLPPVDPEMHLYKKDPLYGIEFQKALSENLDLKGSKEVTVVGMPYYFGILKSYSSDIIYRWRINGASVGEDIKTNSQTFRQVEGQSGVAKISLSAENIEKTLQSARADFNLKFGEDVVNNSLF